MSLWDGLWLTDISFSQHNDLAGLQGGQAGEYYHLTNSEYNQLPVYDSHILDSTIHFTEASLNLPTTYLKLDCTNDPLAGILNSQSIIPSLSANYDLGDSNNFFRTLYLANNGGNVALCQGVQSGGGATNYTFNCGGGYFPGQFNQGGIFTFAMNGIGGTLGTSVNQMVFDVGAVDFAAAAATNDVLFQSFNGIATYAFVSAFGGFNNPEYGYQLRRTSGTELFSKTMIFDNQVPISDFRRSIDFRIDSTNVLTIENESAPAVGDYTVNFPLGQITAPTILNLTAINGLQLNGYGSVTSSTLFGLVDIFTVQANTTNVPVILGMRPNGTNTSSLVFVTNSSDGTNYGFFETSLTGTVARLSTARLNTGTGATQMIIGESISGFLGIGTTDSLTTIDFYFANAIEMQIQPNTLMFNNGAVNTQIDWTTSGELGLQVATNDIIRLTATQIQAIQDIVISDAQNIIINTVTGTKIGTGINQKLSFYNSTPIVQPNTTGQTAGFTVIGGGTNVQEVDTFTGGVGGTAYTIGDIVRHLKNLGLIAA